MLSIKGLVILSPVDKLCPQSPLTASTHPPLDLTTLYSPGLSLFLQLLWDWGHFITAVPFSPSYLSWQPAPTYVFKGL